MKLIFTFLFVMGLVIQGYSQTNISNQNQLDLIRKSENQNNVGWIFLGSGLAMTITSLAIPDTYDSYTGSYTGESNSELRSILGLAGTISIAVSIPIFLSSGSNARMAAKLGLHNQAINQPFPIGIHFGSIPSLSLKIPL